MNGKSVLFAVMLLLAILSCSDRQNERIPPEVLHLLAAKEHFEKQNFFKAINELESAIVINPEQADAHKHLVWLYTRAGDYELAEKHYQKAAQLLSNDSQLEFSWGMLLKTTERYATAELAFVKVIDLNPDHLEAYLHLGYVQTRQGKTDLAIANFQQGLARDSMNQDAHFLLGQEYARLFQMDEALQHLESAGGPRNTNRAIRLRAVAAVHAQLGNIKLAHSRLIQAQELALNGSGSSLAAAIEADLHELCTLREKENCFEP